MSQYPTNNVVERNVFDYLLFDDVNMEDRLFVSWALFEEAMSHLHSRVAMHEKETGKAFDSIYAIPRGGLCPAVKLSYLMKLPIITDPSAIKSTTLVVDECTDTGKTLSKFVDNATLVLFHKPTAMVKPTFIFQETDKQINFCWESMEERN